MASIAKIAVQLTARTRPFQKRMKRASATIKGFAGGIAKSVLKLAKFGAALIGVGVVIGTVIVKKVSDFLDLLDKMSKRTGISAQSLAALGQVAELAGANMETLEKGVKRLQKNILDAEAGLTTAVRGFDALGLSWEELKGKTPEEQLNLVFEGLANVKDASERAAIAQDVMGRAGTALLPILSEGFEAFKALRKESARITGGITPEQVKDAADFKDRITDVKRAFLSLFVQNTGFKILNKIIRFVTESIILLRFKISLAKKTMALFGKVASKAIGGVKTAIAGIVTGFTDLELVGQILTTGFDLAIAKMADSLTFFFTKSLPETLLFFAKRIPIVFVLRKLPELFNIAFNAAINIVKKATELIATILKNPFNPKVVIASYLIGAKTLIEEAGSVATKVFDEVVKDVNKGIDREFTLFEPSVNTEQLSKRFTNLTKQFGKQTKETQKEIEAAVTTAEGLGLKKLGITIDPDDKQAIKDFSKPDLKALERGTAAAFKAEVGKTENEIAKEAKITNEKLDKAVEELQNIGEKLAKGATEVFTF